MMFRLSALAAPALRCGKIREQTGDPAQQQAGPSQESSTLGMAR